MVYHIYTYICIKGLNRPISTWTDTALDSEHFPGSSGQLGAPRGRLCVTLREQMFLRSYYGHFRMLSRLDLGWTSGLTRILNEVIIVWFMLNHFYLIIFLFYYLNLYLLLFIYSFFIFMSFSKMLRVRVNNKHCKIIKFNSNLQNSNTIIIYYYIFIYIQMTQHTYIPINEITHSDDNTCMSNRKSF